MNEVRDICERLLVSPPPLRDSAEVLALARRSVRRRRYATVGSASALAATAVLTFQLTPSGGAALPAPPVVAPAATPTPSTAAAPARVPPARAADIHSTTMRQLLLGIAPAGYAVRDYPVSYDKNFDRNAVLPDREHPAPRNGLLTLAFAGIFLADDGGEGLLSASILAGGSPEALGDECEPVLPDTTCAMVTIDGVRIEVTTWQDEAGRHISATRRLEGGMLTVSIAQGLRGGESQEPLDGKRAGGRIKPPLAGVPVTANQLATLAANPAMLQFP